MELVIIMMTDKYTEQTDFVILNYNLLISILQLYKCFTPIQNLCNR